MAAFSCCSRSELLCTQPLVYFQSNPKLLQVSTLVFVRLVFSLETFVRSAWLLVRNSCCSLVHRPGMNKSRNLLVCHRWISSLPARLGFWISQSFVVSSSLSFQVWFVCLWLKLHGLYQKQYQVYFQYQLLHFSSVLDTKCGQVGQIYPVSMAPQNPPSQKTWTCTAFAAVLRNRYLWWCNCYIYRNQ